MLRRASGRTTHWDVLDMGSFLGGSIARDLASCWQLRLKSEQESLMSEDLTRDV
jgi:hypothetical protein